MRVLTYYIARQCLIANHFLFQVIKRESYISQQLPAVLSKLENLLKSNNGGNGYFVGETVSVDLYIHVV